MSKYVKIKRKIDERFDENKITLERIGEDTYRLTTCKPESHDFKNRIRAEKFDDEFIRQYNNLSEQEDQFELTGSDAYRAMSDLRKRLESGSSEIRLKVKN
jgi:hypothetical protein